MIAGGRTMREAIEAGTFFELIVPGWLEGYAPPACESPAEVLDCFRRRFPRLAPPGATFEVRRIIGGSIGCRIVEPAGFVTVPATPPRPARRARILWQRRELGRHRRERCVCGRPATHEWHRPDHGRREFMCDVCDEAQLRREVTSA